MPISLHMTLQVLSYMTASANAVADEDVHDHGPANVASCPYFRSYLITMPSDGNTNDPLSLIVFVAEHMAVIVANIVSNNGKR